MKAYEIPGHVTLAEGIGGLPKIIVATEWSTAEIYPHGAHVTLFQKTGEPPLLFMSAESEFAEGKPIRGGVPVIFPWFGGKEGLPAHGYARTSAWTLEETSVFAGGEVMLRFRLPAIDSLDVEYVVRVGRLLSLELAVTNAGSHDATFETCFHTYFQIGNIRSVSISGLRECTYLDKVLAEESTESAEAIRITSEVDRVYFNTTAAVEIVDPDLKRRIRVSKCGSQSTVVWNPWIEKSKRMPDFGDEEYLQMLCVESGNVAMNRTSLSSGSRAILKVELSSERID